MLPSNCSQTSSLNSHLDIDDEDHRKPKSEYIAKFNTSSTTPCKRPRLNELGECSPTSLSQNSSMSIMKFFKPQTERFKSLLI